MKKTHFFVAFVFLLIGLLLGFAATNAGSLTLYLWALLRAGLAALALVAVDKVFIRKFNLLEEIGKGNVAAAIFALAWAVLFGWCIGSV